MIPYDNNETFRFAGGGGPNSWPSRENMLSPVVFEGSSSRPLVSRLLAVPALRARYLAHLRTIVEEWLDWEKIGPLVARYQKLIDAEVRADDKKLYSYEAFLSSAGGQTSPDESTGWRGGFGGGASGPSLRSFVTERRDYLRAQPELARLQPEIRAVSAPARPVAGEPMAITARLGANSDRVDSLLLSYALSPLEAFRSVPMADDGAHGDGGPRDGLYGAFLPEVRGGSTVRYYVEARALQSLGSTSFSPAGAEGRAEAVRVPLRRAAATDVVINELMARNSSAVRDPQREYDDWIELANTSSRTVSLDGMYLTDNEEQPRKWRIPSGVSLPPGGYLLVWADEDREATSGLHASFRLSADGELVMLLDTDERGNQILDEVRFPAQEADAALGRYPDARGAFGPVWATPGRRNEPK